MKRCRFCKRPLKSPQAIRLGAGGTCLRKFKGFKAARKIEAQGQMLLFPRKPWGYKKAARRALES